MDRTAQRAVGQNGQVPHEIRPCGLSNHLLAGIENVAPARPASVGAIPTRRVIGGSGPWSSSARHCSMPARPACDTSG